LTFRFFVVRVDVRNYFFPRLPVFCGAPGGKHRE